MPAWRTISWSGRAQARSSETSSADGKQIAGGYGLYRRHCLHCHGVSGRATARRRRSSTRLPRDYRRGMFKFTSTPNGAQPHRDDLSRTVRNGLHGTSMPAFEALLLGRRDRAGGRLRDLPEHSRRDRAGADRRGSDLRRERCRKPCRRRRPGRWRRASSTSGRRPRRRSSTRRSPHPAHAARASFAAANCSWARPRSQAGVHRLPRRRRPVGDGPSFVPQEVFNHVVFGGNPASGTSGIKASSTTRRRISGPEARRVGQPAPPGQPEPGGLQGGAAAARHLLADRQGDHRGPDAVALPGLINEQQIWDLVNFVLGSCPTSPSCSRMRRPPPCPSGRPHDGRPRRLDRTD